MGRCGWGVGVALVLALLGASCGGTGGGPSDSGNQFVFDVRGRLDLAVQTTSDPKRLILTATLLDPQGVPFRNQPIMFTAEFPDATFIPGNDNKATVLTDDSGRASVTLIAGLTTGNMRVTAEAPPALNISTGITVTLTEQGFISLGSLAIIPNTVTFVNPAPGTTFDFQATGGTPPYRFSNSNPSVGTITTLGTAGEIGRYTVTGPLPTTESAARQDTITLQDAAGGQTTATVQILFVTCELTVSPDTINIGDAVGGEQAQITITNGVPPFTVTQTFPDAGSIVIDQQRGIVTFTVAIPPIAVAPNTLLIRDSRGCTATVRVTVTPRAPVPLAISPMSVTLGQGQSATFVIIGGVPPYHIVANGGTANPTTVVGSGGTFVYTAGTVTGVFTITVRDSRDQFVEATVTIQASPPLQVSPSKVTLAQGGSATFVITGGVPPYHIVANGGAANPTTVAESGGTFRYTAGAVTGVFTIVVTDSAGTPFEVQVTIQLPQPGLQVSPSAVTLRQGQSTTFVITGGVPPYHIVANGGAANPTTVAESGGTFRYTAGAVTGVFTIVVTDSAGTPFEVQVTIQPPPPLQVSPSQVTLAPGGSATFVITGGVPPYHIVANGGVANRTTVTVSGGTFVYTAGSVPGMFTIVVTDSAGTPFEVQVTIQATPVQEVGTIVLEATPPSVNGITGGTSTITATVLDHNNLPIQGILVLFTTDKGSVSPLTATTDSSGKARTTLTIPQGTPAGAVTVNGAAAGVTGSVVVTIVTTSPGGGGPPAAIFVDFFANRSGDNNDGTCTTIISALVVDSNGNPVTDGTRVGWTTTAATGLGNPIPVSIISPSFTNQDPSCDVSSYERDTGIAVTPQPSDALTCLKYPQSASGGMVTITATVTGTTVTGDLSDANLPHCPPVSPPSGPTLRLTANPTSINGGTGGNSVITATLLNASGQPLAGELIAFTSTTGAVTSLGLTNASGVAVVTLSISSGTPAGSATVTGTVASGEATGKFTRLDVTIT